MTSFNEFSRAAKDNLIVKLINGFSLYCVIMCCLLCCISFIGSILYVCIAIGCMYVCMYIYSFCYCIVCVSIVYSSSKEERLCRLLGG